MLRIRHAQMQVLRDLCMDDLRRRMRAELESYWSPLCEELGEDGVVQFVDHALERCSFHAIEAEHDHMRYLNAMALLGPDFDEALAWVKPCLANRQVRASTRMDELGAAILRAMKN